MVCEVHNLNINNVHYQIDELSNWLIEQKFFDILGKISCNSRSN